MTGGCWTNAKEVRKYAADQLELSDIKVSDVEEQGDYRLSFWVMGFRGHDDLCFVHINARLETLISFNDNVYVVSVAEVGFMMTRADNVNTEMLDYAKSVTDQIIDRAKEDQP